MILGMSLSAFTQFHVILSLIGIAAGLVALFGLIANRLLSAVTALFLITTVLTNVTALLFPFKGVTPGIILGVLSLIVLVVAIGALYVGKLAGAWRGAYVISASIALWFNVFVLFAQSFAKIPALHDLAPTQSSPAFGITQLIVLVVFIILTWSAFKRFRRA
jgi:hypothetical protein